MPSKEEPSHYINPAKIWFLAHKFLACRAPMFTVHGTRVAYYMLALAKKEHMTATLTRKLVFASFFHDIGTDNDSEIEQLVPFDPKNTYKHSLNSYILLKYYSPLQDFSRALLYHHAYYNRAVTSDPYCRYGLMIHICDRFDVTYNDSKNLARSISRVKSQSGIMFDPEDVNALTEILADGTFVKKIDDGTYQAVVAEYVSSLRFNDVLTQEYLLMLSHLFERDNPATQEHSRAVAVVATDLGYALGLTKEDCSKLFIAGIVHDLGKIMVPPEILEKTTPLSDEEFAIMKKHVSYTRSLLQDCLDPDIIELACRHHERLDGSGYPNNLKGTDLTLPQRILQTANFAISALETRSYKDPGTEGFVIDSLKQMADAGKLDKYCTMAFQENSKAIISDVVSLLKLAEKIDEGALKEAENLSTSGAWCK
jgi:HD-GYP domain-containing protein (c-di-GMP phosphodiesterase class II)